MLKILYAANNNENSKIALSRFLLHLPKKNYQIKIAAYKKSSPNISIDWTLDCLLNIFRPEHISLDNENFNVYFEWIKNYNPDLIISDLEYFTSYIANVLDITLWQCSSSLINFALSHEHKYNLGLFKQYSYLYNRAPLYNQRITNIIDNSNYNFVCSHLGDTTDAPILKQGFEWLRPYYIIGKDYVPCCHNIVAGVIGSNKKILQTLKQYPDSVVFTDFYDEYYYNPQIKNLDNQEEYICNLKNSHIFVCEGQTNFLADAYYNDKKPLVITKITDLECIINSLYSERLGLSHTLHSVNEDILQSFDPNFSHTCNKDIKFLHEKLEDL
jgi:uncharacterized protein (TIGR00661 family)